MIDLIKERCVKKGSTFKLASGQESNIYVDCKGITLHAASLKKLSQYFWDQWLKQNEHPPVIAGVSVGGDPLATALALEGVERGYDVQILLVRKEKKDHGGSQGRAVEGPLPKDLLQHKICLVEDVVSTGTSSAKALKFLKEEGYEVSSMWSILDREMGGSEKLSNDFRISVQSLFKLSDVS